MSCSFWWRVMMPNATKPTGTNTTFQLCLITKSSYSCNGISCHSLRILWRHDVYTTVCTYNAPNIKAFFWSTLYFTCKWKRHHSGELSCQSALFTCEQLPHVHGGYVLQHVRFPSTKLSNTKCISKSNYYA